MSTFLDGRVDGLSEPVGRTTLGVERLPIFQVHRDQGEDPDASEALRDAFFGPHVVVNVQDILPGLRRFSTGTASLDVYTRRRTVWHETEAFWQLDLPHLASRAVRTLPKIPSFGALSERFAAADFLPRSGNGLQLRVETAWRRGTTVAVWHKGKRKDTVVDVSTSHTIVLEIPRVGHLPVVGHGGKLGTVHDRHGNLCALNSGWSQIDDKLKEYDIIPQEQADAQFAKLFEGAEALTFRSRLAYRQIEAAPAAYLAPCWVYDARMTRNGRRISVGAHMLPATTFDATLSPSPERDDLGRFKVRDPKQQVSWPSQAGPRSLISWLGETGGKLPHSRATVSGIVQKLTDAGWICRAFGDADAFEADWRANKTSGVCQADLAWYVGHADGGAIELVPPDNSSLSSARWSFGDPLRWIVVDACGPLKDTISIKKGSIFDRWRTPFAGLHALFGFGTTQEPQGKQGPATVDLALAQQGTLPLAHAWFRAVREHQTNRCSTGVPWVAGMFAVGDNKKSTIDDYLPGRGDAHAGPFNNDLFLAVWMPLA